MPRRNRNACTLTVDADALADQATQVASDLNRTGANGSGHVSHLAIRIDARPPWSHPDERSYWCPACGYLTGAGQHAAAIAHEIPGPDQAITYQDLNLPEPEPHSPRCPCARCLLTPFTTRR
jgi:hypothetical protein